MEIQSNYPRGEMVRESDLILGWGKLYEVVGLAGVASVGQPVSLLLFLQNVNWAVGVGVVSTLAYFGLALWSAFLFEGLVELPLFVRIGLVISSTLAYCVGSLTLFLGLSIWITVVLWRLGVRPGFGNWTGLDYKKRARELSGSGD